MTKTFIKKTIDEFYRTLNESFDMKHYQVVDISMKTCINRKGECFVRIEAIVAVKDKSKGKYYKVTKDYDL